MRLHIVGVLFALSTPALADPPAHPDPVLAPWFQSLTQPGTGWLCCSIADCRPVRYRETGGRYEVFIDSATFPDDGTQWHGHAPNAWVAIPDKVVIRQRENPVGEGVACWYDAEVRCFVPASGS